MAVNDVDPRVGVALGIVESAQVDRDVNPGVVIAEAAMMVADFDLLEHLSTCVGLHQRGREAPIDGVLVVRADALQVMAVGWQLAYKEFTAQGGRGDIHGKTDEGEYHGELQTTVVNHDQWKWTIKGKTSDGKELEVSAKFKRRALASSIPPRAARELGFMVGKWETEMTVNGVRTGTATHEREWAAGKHCLTMSWKAEEKGVPVTAHGISGWDAETKEVIEHWYDSLGRHNSVRWPLAKMKNNSWEGTTTRTYQADRIEGAGRLS